MSFAERHKAWLLPLLALGVLGVVYMNIQMLGSKPAPTPAPAAPAATPAPAPVPAAAPQTEGQGKELWGDLRALETPSPRLLDTAELMRLGERSQEGTSPSRGAMLHPDRWPRTVAPRPAAAATARTDAPPEPPPPLPQVVFVARTPSGPVVWIEQRPYREGDRLPGGYRVTRIALDRVRFEWAGKALERALVPLNAPPKEAP